MQSPFFSRIIFLLKTALYPPSARGGGRGKRNGSRLSPAPRPAGSVKKGKLHMYSTKGRGKAYPLVELSLFTAIILALAFTPGLGYIPLGVTRATVIHIPVIIGSILLGPKKGAFLGGVFGLTSLLNNTFSPTATSFIFSPFYAGGNLWSLAVCFVPRILVGVLPWLIYRGLMKCARGTPSEKWPVFSLGAAGLAASLLHTAMVMGLTWACFGQAYAGAKGVAYNALYRLILGVVAVNGLPEAAVAGVVTALVCRVLVKALKRRA